MPSAQIIETDDGEQIVVFPAGFVIEADEVELSHDGYRVTLTPVIAEIA